MRISNHVRVLIIEDSIDTRDALVQVLKLSGYDTVSTETRDQAVSMLNDVHPDVILMDWSTKGMQPKQFKTVVDALPQKPPLIIMSAYGAADFAMQLGVSYYIQKPFDLDKLIALLQTASTSALRA